jgi:glycosyltransferase involved in cell wall biosynthesis
MASGCAVIGSRVGGIPELIEDGVSGMLFESGNEDHLAALLQKLIENEALRKKTAAAAAQRAVNTFHMQNAVSRLQNLYASLLRGSGIPETTSR